MNITQIYATRNPVYKARRNFTPKGVMVHSTATPGVMASAFSERWNSENYDKCVHAFVDDKGVVELLPRAVRSVHCGTAYSGGPSGNSTHISFEICEPYDMVFHYRNTQSKGGKSNSSYAVKGIQRQLAARGYYNGAIDGVYGPGTESAVSDYQIDKKISADGICGPKTWAALSAESEKYCAYDPNKPDVKTYFDAAYANAVEYAAILCRQFNLNPAAGGVVICHSEGYTRKIASNHSDVMHWFPLHGRNMSMFRYAVKCKMESVATSPAPAPATKDRPVLKKGSYGPEVKEMQTLLIQAGFSCGACGADGSLGSSTDAALRAFQKARGLAADGSCGPLTWSALLE